jgi:hypothetical protein
VTSVRPLVHLNQRTGGTWDVTEVDCEVVSLGVTGGRKQVSRGNSVSPRLNPSYSEMGTLVRNDRLSGHFRDPPWTRYSSILLASTYVGREMPFERLMAVTDATDDWRHAQQRPTQYRTRDDNSLLLLPLANA